MQKGGPTSDRIGPYRVLRQLSVTGSVQVHLAREDGPAGSTRHVVLKVVPTASGEDARDVEELAREVRACAKLTHPSIVRTRHSFPHGSALVLVIEHVEGISLSALLATDADQDRRTLSDEAAFHIAACICNGLAHAHAMQNDAGEDTPIIHRAVGPSNVLIARDGSVKIDAFGFAKMLGGVGTDSTGSMRWTPAYMAPEQVTDRPVTSKVDVYSAALILWELLTGRPSTVLPESIYAIEATLRAVATRKPESLAVLRPDLPREITDAVDLALASKPEARTIDCAEIARRIQRLARLDAGKRELRERVIRTLAVTPTLASIPPQPLAALPAPAPLAAKLPELPFRPPLPPPDGPAPVKISMTLPGDGVPRLPDVIPPPDSTHMPAFVDTVAHSSPPVIRSDSATANDEPRRPESGHVSTELPRWSSLVSRLLAPTPWRRMPWVVAWVGLMGGLAFAVVKLSASGRHATAIAKATPDAPQAESPAPPPSSLGETAPAEGTAASAPAEQVDEGEDFSEALMQRGMGHLTVHSSAPLANVYVNLKPYGRVEQKLAVPCGSRFVSIGVPANRPGEPLWLAPGKMVQIDCGRSFETTMNPRALRSR